MQLLTGYAKPVVALAVTPDGARLFSAAQSQSRIWEWDLAARTVTRKLNCAHARGGVHALAMSPRGDFLVSASEGRGVEFWPLDGGESRQLDPWRGESAYTSPTPGLAIHPAGRLVAASLRARKTGFQTWDLGDGDRNRRYTGHGDYVESIAFSPGGAMVATASRDGTVRVWDLDSSELTHSLSPRVTPGKLAFRPDGKELAVLGARSIFVYDVSTGELVEELTGHGGNVKAIAYSPDGRHLASAGLAGVVVLRDAATRRVVGQRHLDVGKLGSLAWQADANGLIVGGDKLIAVCELAELLGTERAKPKARGEPLSLSGHTKKVVGLCYSRDGRQLASWSQGQLRIWDLSAGAGQAREKIAFKPHDYYGTQTLSWSPDGSQLALTFVLAARITDAQTGQVVEEMSVEGQYPKHLSFTAAGRRLSISKGQTVMDRDLRINLTEPGANAPRSAATVAEQGYYYTVWPEGFGDDERFYLCLGENTISRWTTATGQVEEVIRQGTRVGGLAVTSDERTLVTLGGNSALVWDLPSGKKRLELKHPLIASGLACVPGGRLLTSCYDGLVRLWDLGGGSELFAFDLGMGKVYSLAASPDHMTFAAGVEKKSRIVLMDLPE